MTTSTAHVSVVELSADDDWALEGTVLVSDAIDLALYGHADFSIDVPTVRASMKTNAYRRVHRFVAVRDGERRAEAVVGRGFVHLPLVGDTHTAQVYVGVHPEHRRQGIGSVLWDACLGTARAAGRSVIHAEPAYAPEPPPGPGTLEAPTGSGRIPVDDDTTRFVQARGFSLEQVVRQSLLELPVPAEVLAPLLAEATRAAGPDYVLHAWEDAVPDEWLDGLAMLETRMSTDAPSAGLDVHEDPWDAERMRVGLAERAERDESYVVVAAEHVPTRSLAAFTMVELPRARPEVVYQDDTLVLREHRGRRLGMLVKATMLEELAVRRPRARRVHTWNAEENAFMLGINVALGFRPASVDAVWQLRLDHDERASQDGGTLGR
ncbi:MULTISPECIES: GNAT family N-acetyltransferase [unclassified Actinotalea]|uniref:GNAT family N-acetyltransferase n=1 Tax=unclassified Actinotalea TaxID=2638618 RepID=UPI0015F4669A|nr:MULTISPECIES: GNAT family N-acetyltransferase [unclassified Actinotalea]